MKFIMKTNRIELFQCDITILDVDAIVNAANSSLMGGGGVDGAIHYAAGPRLHEECMEIIKKTGRCPTGGSVITSGGNLPAKYVIHTVGPVWYGGKKNEPVLLGNSYKNSLKIAKEHNLKSIAFPNISTGVYGYPKIEAAEVAITTVKNFLEQNKTPEKVIFVCFDYESYSIYEKLLDIK
jgi:O-acetyl-ADP-ribose deacetylase (regulator of RNase III)